MRFLLVACIQFCSRKKMGWAELHGELLNVILEKLIECTDHLRFSCVCQSWRSAARAHGTPPPLPWLHLPHDPSATDLRFYSLSEDRVYTIPFPVVRNSDVLRSPGGFLLVNGHAVNPKLLIINPFTGTVTALPYRVLSSPDNLVWDYSGLVFVGSYVCGLGALYCRPRNRNHRWSRIKALSYRAITGIVYTAGSFCVLVSKSDEVILLDAETLDETRIIQPPATDFVHWHWYHRFAMSADAGIHYLVDNEYVWNGTTRNIVFNLNLNPQLEKSSWSRIEDTSNCAFVYDKTGRIFVFKATRHPGLRNTIVYPEPVNQDTKVQICNLNEDNLENFCFRLGQFKSSATFSSWILPTFRF